MVTKIGQYFSYFQSYLDLGSTTFILKIGTGILKLITFGGCGIWWLIDVIMIATGSFKDSNGIPIVK